MQGPDREAGCCSFFRFGFQAKKVLAGGGHELLNVRVEHFAGFLFLILLLIHGLNSRECVAKRL